MRNIISFVIRGVAASGLLACNLMGAATTMPADSKMPSVTTYFSDGFEKQGDPLGVPPIGLRWSDAGVGDTYGVIHDPTRVNTGTAALQTATPNSSTQMHLIAVGISGALVAGNNIQYTIHVNQLSIADDPTHNFDSPIQLGIGFTNGQTLAKLGTLDGNSESYMATNGGVATDLGVKVPRNTVPYDTLRAVLHLTTPTPGKLGGTYEVYISLDGGPEQKVATGFALDAVAIPSSESTNPALIIARGGSSSTSLYDDISISDASVSQLVKKP